MEKIAIVQKDSKDDIGYIRYCIHSPYEDDDKNQINVTICYIHVNETHQRRGFARLLMYLFFERIYYHCLQMKYNNAEHVKIELDDMSDLAHTGRSIYVIFGFEYVDPNAPEMVNITTIANIYEQLVEIRPFYNSFLAEHSSVFDFHYIEVGDYVMLPKTIDRM